MSQSFFFNLFFFLQKPPFQWCLVSCAFVHFSPALELNLLHIFLLYSSFFFIFFNIFFSFLIVFDIFPLVLISLFLCVFSSSPPCWFVIGCGLLRGIMCHQPVFWCLACSGQLSLVSGSELCPLRPSSYWQAAQEYFLGRYCPPHVWPHISPSPSENSWCTVFLHSCTI